MAGRPPAVSDYEIVLGIARSRADSGDPAVTTAEIAERLPIKHEGLGRRLNDLADRRLVNRKRVGTSYIWWLPETTYAAVEPYVDQVGASRATGTVTDPIETLFDVGRQRFDLEVGAIARVDPDRDYFEVERASERLAGFEPGTVYPLSETYCITATSERGPASVDDPVRAELDDLTVRRDVGFQTYLGTFLDIRGDDDRTFFFVSTTPRDEPFSDADHAFHDLLGQGAKLELQGARQSPLYG